MPRPLRHIEPGGLYFITSRAFQARYLLRPGTDENEIIASTLAAATERFPDVRLHAFFAASNHVHALCTVDCPNALAGFWGFFFGSVAKRLNNLRGRSGKFWDRRFSVERVLDDEAASAKLAYTLGHAVKDCLVEKAAQWPGFSTLKEALGGPSRTFRWLRHGDFERARERDGKADPDDFAKYYTLHVHPLPHLAGLSADDQVTHIRSLLDAQASDARDRRFAERKRVLGVAAILATDPEDSPTSPKRSSRPPCHTTCLRLRDEYVASYRHFAMVYADASERYRGGERTVAFPRHAFPPPLPAAPD